MNDWYMKRQIQELPARRARSHPQDFSGAQMAAIGQSLTDVQADQ